MPESLLDPQRVFGDGKVNSDALYETIPYHDISAYRFLLQQILSEAQADISIPENSNQEKLVLDAIKEHFIIALSNGCPHPMSAMARAIANIEESQISPESIEKAIFAETVKDGRHLFIFDYIKSHANDQLKTEIEEKSNLLGEEMYEQATSVIIKTIDSYYVEPEFLFNSLKNNIQEISTIEGLTKLVERIKTVVEQRYKLRKEVFEKIIELESLFDPTQSNTQELLEKLGIIIELTKPRDDETEARIIQNYLFTIRMCIITHYYSQTTMHLNKLFEYLGKIWKMEKPDKN